MLISVGLLGLLASLDPLRPVVFLLVLRTDRARLNAIGFLVGWLLALAVLFVAAFAAFNAGDSGQPSSSQRTALAAAELILAIVLVVVALRAWRRRGATTARLNPPVRLLRQLERLTPPRSGILGMLIQPRALTIAAAVIVARDRSSAADAVVGIAVFALVSTGSFLGLFAYFVRRPDRAEGRLAGLVERIEQGGPILLTVGCAVGGVYLFIEGIRGLING